MLKGEILLMPKVSVIMPSFNVCKYIDECLKSVVNQTLKDIEIIVVDAGSTDGTEKIIERYAEIDTRIKVVASEKKSYGYQMNLGIKAATGEYISIVETDDIIEQNMYEKLVPVADEKKLDYVKGYAKQFYELSNGSRYELDIDRNIIEKKYIGVVVDPSKMPWLLLRVFHIWLGIYRRSFLNDIRFNETFGAAFQDIGFILQTVKKAQRAMFLDVHVYNYRHGHTGASVFNHNGLRYLWNEYKSFFNLYDDLEWRSYLYTRMITQSIFRFSMMGIEGRYWKDSESDIVAIHTVMLKAQKNNLIHYTSLSEEKKLLLRLFLLSPIEVYKYYFDVYKYRTEIIKRILIWCECKEVVIWGAGNWGRFIQALLVRNGISVVCFVDSNNTLCGRRIQGVDVVTPQYAKKFFISQKYYIAVKNYADDIRKELLEWGVNSENICFENLVVDNLLFIKKW